MAATDAKPLPIKNNAYRVYFTIFDNDGDPVPSATGLDSEISKDGATIGDCTNEAVYITGSAGGYYLDLTLTEMNCDCAYIEVKTTSTDAKTTVLALYPQEAGDIKVDIQTINGTTINTNSAQIGVNVVTAGATGWNSGSITTGTFAANSVNANALATDAADEIGTRTWLSGTRTLTSGSLLTISGVSGSVGSVTGSVGSVTGSVGSVAGSIGGDLTGSVLGNINGNVLGGVSYVAGDVNGSIQGNLVGNVMGSVVGSVGSVLAGMDANLVTINGYPEPVAGLAQMSLDYASGFFAATVVSAGEVTGNVGGSVGSVVGLDTTNLNNTATRFLTMVVPDGGVWQFTINALELAPSPDGAAGLTPEEHDWLSSCYVKTLPISGGTVTISSPVSREGNRLTLKSGDTWNIPIDNLGDLTTVDKLWFCLKRTAEDADDESLVKIELNVGLEVLGGAPAALPGQGTIGINDPATGGITVHVDEAANITLPTGSGVWAVKSIIGDAATTHVEGESVVTDAVLDAVA
jgi:hypothetical protein